jgi:hypothetical protein
MSERKLAALMLVPTWHETTSRTEESTPHPMTLGRADTYVRTNGTAREENRKLYWDRSQSGDLNVGTHHRVYWHPGLGMWQMDDTNMFGKRLASGRFRPYFSVAKLLATRYCAKPDDFRYLYFPDWIASCGTDAGLCESLYRDIYDEDNDQLRLDSRLIRESGVDYWGGIEEHTCEFRIDGNRDKSSHNAPTVLCYYVDPDNEGLGHVGGGTGGRGIPAHNGWINELEQGGDNGTGPSPLARPFYVMYREPVGAQDRENRVWLEEDLEIDQSLAAQLDHGVSGGRNIDSSARQSLRFFDHTSLCDISFPGGRGNC